MIKKIVLLASFFAFTNFGFTQSRFELNSGWQFKYNDKWYAASVPGCIHTDLLSNGLIEDPFFRANENSHQWIGEKDWEYKTIFKGDSLLQKFENIDLAFEGLDTYADVYLNDSLILKAENMFLGYCIDVSKVLKKNNELRIFFRSPLRIAKEKYAGLAKPLPYDERVMIRKAQYQFGWDWGPKFVTSGIWRKVYLQGWNRAKIVSTQFTQKKLEKEKALLHTEVEIVSSDECEVTVVTKVNFKIAKVFDAKLIKGNNSINYNFDIWNPQLWWVKGYGEQYLYEINTEVFTKKKVLLDKNITEYGVRDIKIIQQPNEKGKSFFVQVNGVPVFIKGANYIPQDVFPSRVTDDKYKAIFENVYELNINMLRVWGGGIYERDLFYNLCDKNGILVWQDFMFGNAMYPGDTSFLSNVKTEVTQNVLRLKNHTCIALWCGNNEIDEGWKNWGMQEQFGYSAEDSIRIWNDYQKIFHQIIPDVLKRYDAERYYHPSSPAIGWGHKESLTEGDSHYWGVWWGDEPFEVYENKIPRFSSEYGFQGMPDMQTVKSFTNFSDRDLQSDVMRSHQKHPRGFEIINNQMKLYYNVPDNFEKYVYVSQLLQAEGVTKAIEAHRCNMPYCMGTMYWQLNDCWQVISWSGMDYYNRWKALNYFVSNAYRQDIISVEERNDSVKVYIVSDDVKSKEGILKIELMDFNGNKLFEKENNVKLAGLSSDVYFSELKKDLIVGYDSAQVFLRCTFQQFEKIYYFTSPKHLKLKPPEININIEKISGTYNPYYGYEYSMRVSSNTLVKNLYLYFDNEYVRFSDNYFDLTTRDLKEIIFRSFEDVQGIREKIKYFSLNN